VRDIGILVIFVAENSNKLRKTRFRKEKSVEDVVTLGPRAEPLVLIMRTKFQDFFRNYYGVCTQVKSIKLIIS